MTNAEAIARLNKLTESYNTMRAAARIVSEETGADFVYLYWLTRMTGLTGNLDPLAQVKMKKTKAIEDPDRPSRREVIMAQRLRKT